MNSSLESHLPKIRSLVRSLVKDPTLADDATQECCIRLIEKERLWDPGKGAYGAWAHSVARRVCFNLLSRNRAPRPVDPQTLEARPDSKRDGQEGVFSEEQILWVLGQFGSLPDLQKRILQMMYFEGKTQAEIALALGISQSTVSSQHARSLERLRRRGLGQRILGLVMGSWFPESWGLKAKVAGGAVAAGLALSASFFIPGDETLIITTTAELKATRVLMNPGLFMNPAENTLWCATAPLAWSHLQKEVGGDLRMQGNPPVIEALNRGAFPEGDLDPQSYVVGAGDVQQGIVEKLQKEIIRKFKEGRDPVLDAMARTPEAGLLAYAYLHKTLPFETPFESLDDGVTVTTRRGERVEVPCFGIEKYDPTKGAHQDMNKQIHVHAPVEHPLKNYVVRLLAKGSLGEVVLAKVSADSTLEKTMERALGLATSLKGEKMSHDDSLVIPKFSFHLTHDEKSLRGLKLLNPGFEDQRLAALTQSFWFRMDETGVIFHNRFAIMATRNIPMELVFEPPFLLMLREAPGKKPYFAMWVANGELLVKPEQ